MWWRLTSGASLPGAGESSPATPLFPPAHYQLSQSILYQRVHRESLKLLLHVGSCIKKFVSFIRVYISIKTREGSLKLSEFLNDSKFNMVNLNFFNFKNFLQSVNYNSTSLAH